MPQDSVQQAIARGAIGRISLHLPAGLGDFEDARVALSGIEWKTVLAALQEFVRVPAESEQNGN